MREGAGRPTTLYTRNDVVTHDNAAYVVRLQHTSGATFDPNLAISGEPVYQLLVSRPQGMLWRGIYATGTAYAFYDVIRVLGSGDLAGEDSAYDGSGGSLRSRQGD